MEESNEERRLLAVYLELWLDGPNRYEFILYHINKFYKELP